MEEAPVYENRRGVERMRRIDAFVGRFKRRLGMGPRAGRWPREAGRYRVLDPNGVVAVCTVTSKLWSSLEAPGVAVAGSLRTANLGIEKIVRNVIANPRIRFLVLCGKESELFHPGQSLVSLFEHGVDDARRIVGAKGHLPELGGLSTREIEQFREQVELVNLLDEVDEPRIRDAIAACVARDPGPFTGELAEISARAEPKKLARGQRRKSIEYDRMGFFVIQVHTEAGEIELVHHDSTKAPAHVVRGKSAESLWLPVLEAGLVTQLSHAAYLGAELAKAETALRWGTPYEQDQPLRTPVTA